MNWQEDKLTYWEFLKVNPLKILWMICVIGVASTFIVYIVFHIEEALETPIWGLIVCGIISLGMIIGAFAQTYSEYKAYLKE